MDPLQGRSSHPSRRRGGGVDRTHGRSPERYRHLTNPFEPLRVFSEDEVACIHEAALTILENEGMRILLPEARQRFATAGALVDESTQMVRIDRGFVAQSLSGAPPLIEMTAPAPSRNVTVGGRHLTIMPVSGPPNASDLDRGRRPGMLRDFQ